MAQGVRRQWQHRGYGQAQGFFRQVGGIADANQLFERRSGIAFGGRQQSWKHTQPRSGADQPQRDNPLRVIERHLHRYRAAERMPRDTHARDMARIEIGPHGGGEPRDGGGIGVASWARSPCPGRSQVMAESGGRSASWRIQPMWLSPEPLSKRSGAVVGGVIVGDAPFLLCYTRGILRYFQRR